MPTSSRSIRTPSEASISLPSRRRHSHSRASRQLSPRESQKRSAVRSSTRKRWPAETTDRASARNACSVRRSSSPLTRSTAHSSACTIAVTANDRISELMPSRLSAAVRRTTAAARRRTTGRPGSPAPSPPYGPAARALRAPVRACGQGDRAPERAETVRFSSVAGSLPRRHACYKPDAGGNGQSRDRTETGISQNSSRSDPMRAEERQHRILALARQSGRVEVADAAAEFGRRPGDRPARSARAGAPGPAPAHPRRRVSRGERRLRDHARPAGDPARRREAPDRGGRRGAARRRRDGLRRRGLHPAADRRGSARRTGR